MKIRLSEAHSIFEAWQNGDYTFLRRYFGRLERARNNGLAVKYESAVNRIEAEFEKTFRMAAWDPAWSIDVIADHRKALVGFIDALSVKALIDDMHALWDARKARPHNLKYFMFAKGGEDSRWDKLISASYLQKWQQFKDAENAPHNRTSSKSIRQIKTEFGTTKQEPEREIDVTKLFARLMEDAPVKPKIRQAYTPKGSANE